MNINSRATLIGALTIATLLAGGYRLVSGNRDAVTAQRSSIRPQAITSGERRQRNAPKITAASSADSIPDSRLTEISQQIGELRKQQRTKTRSADDRIDQLDHQIDKLWNEFGYLAGEVGASTDADISLTAGEEDAHIGDEDDEQRVIQQIEEEFAFYDDVGSNEGADESWSADAEAQLYESFQDISQQGVGVDEVVCHSTFCRADLSIDPENPNEAIGRLQNVTPWEGESVVWIKDLELGIGVMYVAREGNSLPHFE